jgi:sugar phosphate isomerase/epimerase
MNLAISNIAWRPDENAAIYPLLTEVGVRGLEIAPALAFGEAADPFLPTEAEISHFRSELDAHSLKLVSMQSLLFGAENARLFGDTPARMAFETRLEQAIALAKRLEISNLVVGSPTHRAIPAGMGRATAERIACAMFRKLGDKAGKANTKLALEPNPAAYGTNFLTTMGETITFAALVDHPAITLNFDIGALHMNGEADSAMALYRRGASKVSHVHVSEPNLSPAPQSEATFGAIAQDLIKNGYGEHNRDNVRARAEACARWLRSAIA